MESYQNFILSYWSLWSFWSVCLSGGNLLFQPQDSLLWCKGSLVIAAPSPPQQVSPLLTCPAMALISLAYPVLQNKNKARHTLQLHTRRAFLAFCEGIRRAVELWFYVLFYSRLLRKNFKTVDEKSCRHIVVTMPMSSFSDTYNDSCSTASVESDTKESEVAKSFPAEQRAGSWTAGPAFLRTHPPVFILGGHWIKVAFLTSSEVHNSLKFYQHEQMRTVLSTWQAGKNKLERSIKHPENIKPTFSIRGEKCFLHWLSKCFRRCGLN